MFKYLKNSRGSALVVALLMLIMLSFIGIASITTSVRDMDISHNTTQKTKAFNVAEAGIELSLATVNANPVWRTGFSNQSMGGGTFDVAVVDSSTDVSLAGNLRVTSTGHLGDAQSVIEAIFGPPGVHPLYNNAIYAGNYLEYDPDADTQSWSATMNFGGTGSEKDLITGDVFFNGNVHSGGQSQVNGTINAGGTITGNPPTGDANSYVDYLEPPDLAGMNYGSTSDFYINSSSPWNSKGQIASTDPRHIFVKEYRSDLAKDKGISFTNTNYFLGDPWESKNIDKVSVSSDGNHKVYFVDGNLWIEPVGETSQIIKSPPDGTQITVVVKGNIYMCDNLLYNNPALDAIAFVAMTDGESYEDLNGDNKYQSNEPILHDNGNGIYEGPNEGSGNIFFGDPNGGPLGTVNAFLYAENDFVDYVLDGTSGDPLDFAINGIMSAGNYLKIKRDFNGKHAQMKVTYDSRLKDGAITLPGLPKGNQNTGGASWSILSWRELY